MKFATLNAEPAGDEVRVETHAGRKHLVAPVVMVREGVLNGGYLPFDAINESVPGWNGRPITAPPNTDASGHPVDDDGNFVSANDAEFLEAMQVGFLQQPEAVEDLPAANDESSSMSRKGARAEMWVDLSAAEEVGEAAVEAARRLAEGEPLEVSTGYFHKRVDRPGSFNGERYDHEQYGLMPDHLALLPNERGACSWKDGCGAPRVNTLPTMNVNQAEGDRVRWEASDGEVRYGIIVDDQEGEEADEVLVAVYAWSGEEWEATDTTVNLATDTFEVIEQFPSQPDDEIVDNVAPAARRNLATRMKHAANVLAGNADGCGCGCGGTADTDTTTETESTMSDTDIEALADELGIAVDTLEAMDDDEVESLASNVGSDDDGTEDGDAPDDEPTDEVTALRKQVEELTETVGDLAEQQNKSPEAEAAREFLAENTGRELDALAEWPDEAVVETAEAHGFGANYAAPRGDRVNRLGQAGGPTANGGGGEDLDGYVEKSGAFNQLEADEGGD